MPTSDKESGRLRGAEVERSERALKMGAGASGLGGPALASAGGVGHGGTYEFAPEGWIGRATATGSASVAERGGGCARAASGDALSEDIAFAIA
eukprot:1315224-Pleurochrysis_carterae.AAC.1